MYLPLLQTTIYYEEVSGEGFLSDCLANDGSGLDSILALAFCNKSLVEGRGRCESNALDVVDELAVDLLVAPEYAKTGLLSGTADLLADAVMYSLSSLYFSQCHNAFLLLLGCGSLSGLAAQNLTDKLDTLALIRLRTTE